MTIYKSKDGEFIIQLIDKENLKELPQNNIHLGSDVKDVMTAIQRSKAYFESKVDAAFYEAITNNFKRR